MVDGSNRGYITTRSAAFEMFIESNKSFEFKTISERIMSYHWGFVFDVDNFMFKSFNRKVVQLVESGIADVLVKKAQFLKPKIKEEGPVTLNLDHLGIWFIVWSVFLAVAFVCFLCEVLLPKVIADLENNCGLYRKLTGLPGVEGPRRIFLKP